MFEAKEAQINGRNALPAARQGARLGTDRSTAGLCAAPAQITTAAARDGCEELGARRRSAFLLQGRETASRRRRIPRESAVSLKSPNPVRSRSGAMVAAAIEAGIPGQRDFNGARQEGVGYYRRETQQARRLERGARYLRAAQGPPPTDGRDRTRRDTGSCRRRPRRSRFEYHTPDAPSGRAPRRDRGSGRVYDRRNCMQAVGSRPGDPLRESASRWCARWRGSARYARTIPTPNGCGAAARR